METLSLEGGFADPVHAAQTAFRAIMDSLANPGTARALGVVTAPPVALTPELAVVALTLCDHDSLVWLDPALRADEGVVAWLRFHTGAPLTNDPAQAAFALVSGAEHLPALENFALGSDEYPDRSTTIALAVPALEGGADLVLRGPGIRDHGHFAPGGLPEDFVSQWAGNRALFPRGVDLLLVAGGQVTGLPRTTRITMEAH